MLSHIPTSSVLAVDPVVLPDGALGQQFLRHAPLVPEDGGEYLLPVAAGRPDRPRVLQRPVVVADPGRLPGPGMARCG